MYTPCQKKIIGIYQIFRYYPYCSLPPTSHAALRCEVREGREERKKNQTGTAHKARPHLISFQFVHLRIISFPPIRASPPPTHKPFFSIFSFFPSLRTVHLIRPYPPLVSTHISQITFKYSNSAPYPSLQTPTSTQSLIRAFNIHNPRIWGKTYIYSH